MGITTAQFTLGAGVISLIGGEISGFDIRLPFLVALGAALLALAMIFLSWRAPEIRRITQE